MSGGPDLRRKPEPPRHPEPWECCQSGCEPGVYDRYWEDLARYERALEASRIRHRPRHSDSSAD
ncbi:MAG: oxidoreductase-like domain-containing protein [Betaproteobacteria bacterium]|nr:oxidoreductase-like domain-containing protein [Betaproteobacteria bacterium]